MFISKSVSDFNVTLIQPRISYFYLIKFCCNTFCRYQNHFPMISLIFRKKTTQLKKETFLVQASMKMILPLKFVSLASMKMILPLKFVSLVTLRSETFLYTNTSNSHGLNDKLQCTLFFSFLFKYLKSKEEIECGRNTMKEKK